MIKRSVLAFAAIILPALCSLCSVSPALAVSTLSLSPAGDGVFALQGAGIEDASAFDITIAYDTSSLANPRVVEGPLIAGGMTAVNPNAPGVVRIVVIRVAPVRGSGLIATLAFTRIGSSPGRINAMNVRLANATGAPLQAQAHIVNPSGQNADASPSAQEQTPASGQVVTPIIVAPTGPLVEQPVRTAEEEPRSGETTSVSGQDVQEPAQHDQPARPEAADSTAENTGSQPAPRRKVFMQKGVLDRFREFKGPRSVDAFIALFDEENMIGWRQSPSIAVTDGKAELTVGFIAPPGQVNPSDISVRGARLLSLSRDPDNTNTWIARVLPNKGSSEAAFTVSLGELTITYPLTVAPGIAVKGPKTGKLSKAVFEDYLKGKAGVLQKLDLNGDGKRDYRDDYILTANYLRAVRKAP